jgi:hypothetical protein
MMAGHSLTINFDRVGNRFNVAEAGHRIVIRRADF